MLNTETRDWYSGKTELDIAQEIVSSTRRWLVLIEQRGWPDDAELMQRWRRYANVLDEEVRETLLLSFMDTAGD